MKHSNAIGMTLLFFIFLLFILAAYGTMNPLKNLMKEIEENSFVDTIGIDKTDEKEVKVSISFPVYSSSNDTKSQGGSSPKSENMILSASGETVFQAHRDLHLLTQKNLSYGHTKYIIFGERAMTDDISNILDFEMRDYERGWNTKAIIAKGAPVEAFLSEATKNADTVNKQILGMIDTSGDLSISHDIDLKAIISYVYDNASFCIPYIMIEPEKPGEALLNIEKVRVGGLAVIKDRKLYDFLSPELSRGVNWITNEIHSLCIIPKIYPKYNPSLEVLHSYAAIETRFEDDIPTAKIKIKVKSQVSELGQNKSLLMSDAIELLQKKQAEFITAEVRAALDYAQNNRVDILGIGDSLFHQHPIGWKKIEKNWDKIFPKMKINIVVDSYVTTTGIVRKSWIEGEKT